MKRWSVCNTWIAFTWLATGLCAAAEAPTPVIERLAEQVVRVRLMDGEDRITFHGDAPLNIYMADDWGKLPAGTYTFTASDVTPAQQRFHLFAKGFEVNQQAEETEYLRDMRQKGFDPEVVVIGKRLQTEHGTILDNRVHWISIARANTESEALAKKAALESAGQWTWMNMEITAPGSAEIRALGADGKVYGPMAAPLRIESSLPVGLSDVDVGFWEPRKEKLRVAGDIHVGIGADRKLELVESLPVEEYLKGVLPAEMPASWPKEALNAQAVAARSEVLVNLSTKHSLEQVDFCGREHCRAYRGAGGHLNATTEAVLATAGLIMVDGDRIAVTVFSANCGGHTENNDTVWSAPPNRVLRGVRDGGGGSSTSNLAQWLKQRPAAHCADDGTHFRWRQSYSTAELSAIVNQRYNVGTIREIQLGERGVSGRLKWVRVVGTKGTETIHKELPIRQAFGGLPSALFVTEVSNPGSGGKTFAFIGAGRGHGVGMCQFGARGMAMRGESFESILTHYFTGVTIERYR